MKVDKKKLAAISTAVYYYLQAEQQSQLALQQQFQQPVMPQQATFPVSSPWALAGRQAIMDRRCQMQFKTFR